MLLIDEPATGLDTSTATHVLMAVRRRLPHAVLVLAMHEMPADYGALGRAWSEVPLDQRGQPVAGPEPGAGDHGAVGQPLR